jgi:hypothetical protein
MVHHHLFLFLLVFSALATASAATLITMVLERRRRLQSTSEARKIPVTEYFTTSINNSVPSFVSRDEFGQVFLSSGHLCNTSSDADLKARGIHDGDHVSAQHAYLSGFVEPATLSSEDVSALADATKEADLACHNAGCHLLRSIPWKLAILEDYVENGYPHTMGTVVCLPRKFLRSLESIRSPMLGKHTVTVLIHEKIHVFQKTYAATLTPEIIAAMGYVKRLPMASLPRQIRDRLRSNPDLDGYMYMYQGIYDVRRRGLTCAALYPSDRHPTSLADVSIEGIDGYLSKTRQCPFEHPLEEMAYKCASSIITGKGEGNPFLMYM